jgi:hypothetical protein
MTHFQDVSQFGGKNNFADRDTGVEGLTHAT